MYVIVATLQIQQEHRETFIEEMLNDARGSVNDEPGCLRFDVIQDEKDPNRIYLYEIIGCKFKLMIINPKYAGACVQNIDAGS